MRLQGLAGHPGIDDYCVSQSRRRFDAAQVVLGLPRLGVFRVLDRDQVMHETDKPRAPARSDALEDPPFFEMVMRHQQIDRRLRARPQM